jgi:hypothetical protein
VIYNQALPVIIKITAAPSEADITPLELAALEALENLKRGEEMTIQQKLNDLQTRINTLKKSGDYSPAYKAKLLAALDVEKSNLKAQALAELGAAWQAVRADYDKLTQAGAELETRAADGWDYARLDYMAKAAKAAIAQAASAGDLGALYNQAQASSDPYTRRAWAELAPEFARSKFGANLETGRLERQAARDLQAAIYHNQPGELQALQARWGELIERALSLRTETEAAESMLLSYGDINMARIGGTGTEFDRLMTGINLTQRVDPADLCTYTTMTIAEG